MKTPSDTRKDRLAEALRENLKRRKAVARARKQAPAASTDKGEPPQRERGPNPAVKSR